MAKAPRRDANRLPSARAAAPAFAWALCWAMLALPGPAWAQEPEASGGDSKANCVDAPVAVPAPPADAGLPEVEPVIPDDEFGSIVPPFGPCGDDELGRPLESLEEFKRSLDAQAPEAPPLGDEELVAPLPPLESFEAQPVELAGDGAAAQPGELKYRIELAGLDEAEGGTARDMRRLFDSLSTLKAGKGKAANLSQIRARLTEDAQLLGTILASQGYYDPVVTTRIEGAEEDGQGELVAVIDADPGKRFAFASIAVEAGPTEPADLIGKNLRLSSGDPIVAERVEAAEARVMLALPQNGYPFAKLAEREILLDRDTGEGDYKLPVETGPRARFGAIRTTGEEAFGAGHTAVIARFERGQLYDSRKADDLEKALIATGLFSAVSVTPEPTGGDAGDGTQYVDMVVDQHAGPPRTIAARAGYGTGEGLRAEGSWTHRNLLGPEGALILTATAGTQAQGFDVTFKRANAGRRDRTFQISAEVNRSNYAAVDAYTGRIAALVSYSSTPIWRKKLTYAYGGQLLVTGEDDYDFDIGARGRRTFYIAGLTGQLGFDWTDDLYDPSKGFRSTLLVEPEASADGGFHPYVRVQLDGSAYYPVSDSLVVAGRIGLGSIQGIERFNLAPSRRFYAGGGGSVRGFGFQELGPQAPDGRPIGGRSFNEASAEIRYRFGDYGVAAFVDAGQAYESSLPRFTDLRFGAGIGGRYYTNFGPIRVDLATPLDRRPGEGWLSVYVSIGQAF